MTEDLGNVIRELREASGLSQRELARRLQVDGSYLSHLEAGRRDPSLSFLRRLAQEVSAPLALLLGTSLLQGLSERERSLYEPVLQQLVELSKSRQLDLVSDDDGQASGP